MGSAAVVFVAHRAVWLADKGLTRVGDVVDSVAEAAVTVVEAAFFAGAETVDWWTRVLVHATFLLVRIGAWLWVLKLRLRLSGREPEANVFSEADVFATARNPKGVKACSSKLTLQHLSGDGKVHYKVQASGTGEYLVLLDYRAFRAGGSPGQVVLSCTCIDYVTKGGVCKHGGACCLHLLQRTSEVERASLAAPTVPVPAALELPGPVRRAQSAGALRTPVSAREGSLCLAGLMRKAKELQARAFQQPPLPAVVVEREVMCRPRRSCDPLRLS